jgi:hypothetical protein
LADAEHEALAGPDDGRKPLTNFFTALFVRYMLIRSTVDFA